MNIEIKQKVENVLQTVRICRGRGHSRAAILDKILKSGEPYFSNGISSVDDELDFCQSVSVALDECSYLNMSYDARIELLNRIYDAVGFPHYWEG